MNFGFDTQNTAPSRPAFDPLKPGWYPARIVGAEIIESSKPEVGEMLKLTLEIIGDTQGQKSVGRKVFHYLCHHHEKPQTREIAQSQIVTILDCIGKRGATSADVMLGADIKVKLSVRPASGNYEASNDVKGYKPIGEADTEVGAAAGKPAAAVTQTKSAPWGKKS